MNLYKSVRLKHGYLNDMENKRIAISKIALFVIFAYQLIPLTGQEAKSDSLLTAQLQEIKKTVIQDKKIAQTWWYGWLAGYSAATVGQGIVYFSSDNKSTKQDMALGAATTALGALGQIIAPLVPHNLSLQDFQVPGYSLEGKPGETMYYEELLKEIAAREKKGRSWKMHALTGAVNMSTGLITWLGFKRSVWDGIGIFALNTAVTELQIWTLPAGAIRDYKSYCKKYGSFPGQEALKREKEWVVLAYPGGIKIEMNF
jgi:hypothetical protein